MAKRPLPPPAPEDGERLAPQNLEAERSVLGSILLRNASYEVAARIVKADDFYRRAHQTIFAAFIRLLERPDGEVDLVLLKDHLANRGELDDVGLGYLSALIDGVPQSTSVAHYAGIVKEKSILRSIIKLANNVLAKAFDGEEPATDILAMSDRGIVELQTGVTHGKMRSLASTTGEFLDRIEWREQHRGELLGVPTGFAEVDDLTLGWQRGNMIIIAAKTSIGKTTFVMNSGVHLATKLRPWDSVPYQVAYFSMEMKRVQLETRISAMLSGIPITNIQTGTLVGEREWGLLSTAVGTMHESGLHIDDTASHTVQSIRRECRRLKSEKGLDLVIIDYVQLMAGSSDRRGATRNEEMTQISRQLKLLFDELDVPGLVLSQLNRAGAGRSDPTPKLSDLRESGSLEQDADLVAFLHRKNHRVDGHTWFICEKDRNGSTGTANLTLHKDIGRFENGGIEAIPTPEEKKAEDQDAKTRAIIKARARKHRG